MVLLKKYDIIFIVRDLFKKIIVGIALLYAPHVFAEDYSVLVIPDNIVTENASVDSFIYNATAEFFADDVINLLNTTDNISSPMVSNVRANFKQDASTMLAAKALTNKFRTTYNIDYATLKKLAQKENSRYALLMTAYIDAENYILRRTPWDVLNIPGASVIDPAYKISTYAVLVDTETNAKLWSDTFYKTISVCENRIITRGPSPQVEQLSKIKDYSRYISPQIARNVQRNILPADLYTSESTQIDYDMGNIDNVFTKKYRHLKKEYDKVYAQKKQQANIFVDDKKQKLEKIKQDYSERNAIRRDAELEEIKRYEELKVKARPVLEQDNTESLFNNISNKLKFGNNADKSTVFQKKTVDLEYCELIRLEIEKKKRSNRLIGDDIEACRPYLREYYK